MRRYTKIIANNLIDVKDKESAFDRKYTAILLKIPKQDRLNDIVPMATHLASWVLAHLSLYEQLPIQRFKEACCSMFVSAESVMIRIRDNPSLRRCKPKKGGEYLMLQGEIEGDAEQIDHQIRIPDGEIDAGLNYRCRIEYLMGVYLQNAIIPSCGEPDDAIASGYLLKIAEESTPERNICLFSTALYYATEPYRNELKPYAVMLLDRFENPDIRRHLVPLIHALGVEG